MPEAAANEAPQKNAADMTREAVMDKGYAWKHVTEIDETQMEAVYALAYRHFNHGQYAKAEQLFKFLYSLDHYDSRFPIGLGAARQKQQKYNDAVNAYSAAAGIDIENPVPPLRSAECYMAQQDYELAKKAAKAAIYWAEGKPEHQKTRARADLILKGIEARRQKEKAKALKK